jgi:IS5 family transposase
VFFDIFSGMRKRFEVQLELGAVPIEFVKIPTRTRDELPPTLAALQWIFVTPEVNEQVFSLLEESILSDHPDLGRRGMDLWQVLVFGVVRLTLDVNYDRLHHIANFDSLVRQLLGQPAFDMELEFALSTIKENAGLLSEELLEQINAVVSNHGHDCIKKKDATLEIKADSYVFETNVHFPTDLNLAWDCARKCIILSARLARFNQLEGWRKHQYWLNTTKGLARACGRASRGRGKFKEDRIVKTAQDYLAKLYSIEGKVLSLLAELRALEASEELSLKLEELGRYHDLLIKHIFLISDRLIEGRTIAAGDKLYSIFEQHTEWVNKGKSRPNVELGHRLLIATDQYGVIHDYKIMLGGDEAAEVAPLADRLIAKLGLDNISSFSVDRGFSSIKNRELLELNMPDTHIIMPKKGKLSAADKERQSQKAWRILANKHSAVESNINCLEHHGLNRCPDKGYQAYARYAGLGVLAYNLHKIGNHLLDARREADKVAKAA